MDYKCLFEEAVKRENDFRDAAFLNLTTNICGIELPQMTPRDFLILDGIGSPYIVGGERTLTDLVNFLWHLSDHRRGKLRYAFFYGRCWMMDFELSEYWVAQYLQRTFLDSPGGTPSANRESYAAWIAYLVDHVASEYGWALDDVMNTPLRILYQQIRCILLRHNPDRKFINPLSRKVIGERLRLKQQRLNLVNLLAKRARQN